MQIELPITLILTSSVVGTLVGTGITAFVNWRIQKNNYRSEYYKMILGKRIEAYENVISVVDVMKLLVQEPDGKLSVRFLRNQDDYDNFVIGLVIGSKQAFWLSQKMQVALTELNIFLINKIGNKIDTELKSEAQWIRASIENRDSISEFRKRLEKLLYDDLKQLHIIDKFIERPKKTESFEVERPKIK